MLIPLSTNPDKGPRDLVENLRECHERIRRFAALARDVATSTAAACPEVADACVAVKRYFEEALPMHEADEEESLAPRLRGMNPDVDRTLDEMVHQHREHGPLLDALLRAVDLVGGNPRDAKARAALGDAAAALEAAFARHLALEERVIFPAIRSFLPTQTQNQILAELRQRRRDPEAHAGGRAREPGRGS